MIRYALKCNEGHSFESWFKSADAFDALADKNLVTCAVCGTSDVSKAMMAPRVSAKENQNTSLSAPANPAEQALAELKRNVEENADYVGTSFAEEARKIHDGEATDRPIWGEAKLPEAKALIDDGVPVAPLPFVPTRKAN